MSKTMTYVRNIVRKKYIEERSGIVSEKTEIEFKECVKKYPLIVEQVKRMLFEPLNKGE